MRELSLAAAMVVAVTVAAAGQAAQPDASLSLTLDEAIRLGVDQSDRIEEANARGEGAAAAVDERRAASLPQFAAQAGYTRTNHVQQFGVLLPNNQLRIIYPDVPDNFRTRVDAQWLTYSGGRLEALTDAARSDAAAAATDIDTVRADVRLEIARAYWSLVTALESVQVVDESLARVGRHLVDVRNQLAAGLVPPNDVLTVEAQESRQRMLSIQARANRDVAEAELGRLIGVGPGTRIQTASRLENNANNANNADSAGNTAPSDPRVPTLGGLLETARQNRPERKALLQRLEAAGGRHRAALAASKPTIAIAGGVDYARPNPRIFPREATWRESWDASINLSWPLFDGGRTVAEIKGAVATERAIAARLGEFDAALGLELRQRLSEIEANRAAIAAAEDGVRAATEARRVVGERFAAGVATSSDVLDAQVAVLQAGLDRTQALASRRIAEARLARSLGSR